MVFTWWICGALLPSVKHFICLLHSLITKQENILQRFTHVAHRPIHQYNTNVVLGPQIFVIC